MLQQLTPEQFAEWRAFLRHREIQRERDLAGLLAVINNAGWLAAAANGARVAEGMFKEPNDFLHDDAKIEAGPKQRLTAEESAQRNAERYGRK